MNNLVTELIGTSILVFGVPAIGFYGGELPGADRGAAGRWDTRRRVLRRTLPW